MQHRSLRTSVLRVISFVRGSTAASCAGVYQTAHPTSNTLTHGWCVSTRSHSEIAAHRRTYKRSSGNQNGSRSPGILSHLKSRCTWSQSSEIASPIICLCRSICPPISQIYPRRLPPAVRSQRYQRPSHLPSRSENDGFPLSFQLCGRSARSKGSAVSSPFAADPRFWD